MARGLRVDDLPHLVRPGMERAALERAVSQNFEAVQGGLRVLRDALQQVLDQPSEDLEVDFAAPEGIVTTFSRRKQKRRVSYHVAVRCTLPENDEPMDRLMVQMAYVDVTGATYKELDSDGDPVIHRALVDLPPDTDDIGKVKAVFKNLEKPRYWYVKFRMRWGSSAGWGAFSPWTTPELPKNEVTQSASGTVTITEHKHNQPGVHVWKWSEVDAEDVNFDRYHVYVERLNDDASWTVVDEGYTRSSKWRYEVPTSDRGTKHRIKVYVVDEDGNDASVTTSDEEDDQAQLSAGDVEPLATGSIDFGNANLSPDGSITLPTQPAAGGYETPSRRQTAANENFTQANKTVTWDAATKTGSLLIAQVLLKKAGGAPSITTPAGWTLLGSTQTFGNFRMGCYYKANAAAQSSQAWSFGSAPDYGTILMAEYEGLESVPLDKEATSSGTSTTASTGTTATTAQAAELWVGFLASEWGLLAPSNGFTYVRGYSGSLPGQFILNKVVAATGAASTTMGLRFGETGQWVGRMATFKAKAVSTQTIPTPDDDKIGLFAKHVGTESRLAYKDDSGAEHILYGRFTGCRAYKATTVQTIGSGNTAGVTLNTEVADPLGMHDTVTNSDRFTIPTGYDGVWRFHACADADAAAAHGNRYRIQLRKNGTTNMTNVTTVAHTATGGHSFIPADIMLDLVAGDYIEFRIESPDEAVDIQAGSTVTYMEAVFLGAA